MKSAVYFLLLMDMKHHHMTQEPMSMSAMLCYASVSSGVAWHQMQAEDYPLSHESQESPPHIIRFLVHDC